MTRSRLAVLLVPLLVLAGCNSSAPSVVVSAAEVVRRAEQRTTDVGSAKLAMRMDGGGVLMTATGVTSLHELKMAMTLTVEAQGRSFTSQMRMIGNRMWMTAPPGAKFDEPWVGFDLDALLKRQDVDLGAVEEMMDRDPSQTLSYLQGASDDIHETGTEELRGVKTTRYEGTLDLAKARDAQPSERARAMLDRAIEKLGATTMPIAVWIDGEGRMRKMRQTVDLAKASKGQATGDMTVEIELYEFGAPVDVTPPPADQVADGTSLLAQQR